MQAALVNERLFFFDKENKDFFIFSLPTSSVQESFPAQAFPRRTPLRLISQTFVDRMLENNAFVWL